MSSLLSKEVVSIILGGGAGSRLYPLTANRSKPAVPIAGKYRLVDIPISNCINSGINRIYVLTQFNSASLNRHIKNTYQFSHFNLGFVDILAAEQTPESTAWYQGTADAVRQSMKHVSTQDFEYVLILSGDQLYQIDFDDMIAQHKQSNAEISIATIPVTSEDAVSLGILKVNGDKKITSFIEKPAVHLHQDWVSDTGEKERSKGKNFFASMGIYVFNRSVIMELLFSQYPEATDFGKEIIPNSIGAYRVQSYQYNGYWADIGNISSFFECNLQLTEDIPAIDLYDSSQTIFTRPRMLPAAKITGSRLDHAIIAEGSILLTKKIEHSIIGIRSRIGFESEILNTYVMGNDYYETLEIIDEQKKQGIPPLGIGDYCYINNAIIDKNVHIGNHVKINGHAEMENTDQKYYTVKDGIVVIKKGAILPDGYEIV